MFSVNALYAAPSVFTEAARCSGNRGALCKSSNCLALICASVIGAVPSAGIFKLKGSVHPSTSQTKLPKSWNNWS
jgi:hypothetical protein